MRASVLFKKFVLPVNFLLITVFSFSQGQNGFNIQSRINKSRVVFIAEDSKIKVKLENGNEIMGNLSGADSSAIYITRSNGKQKAIAIGSINKMTVFHPHQYFTLLGGLAEAGVNGCGNNCSIVESAIVLVAFVAITAGELIVDGIADVANDEHYDMVNSWKIIGPVAGR